MENLLKAAQALKWIELKQLKIYIKADWCCNLWTFVQNKQTCTQYNDTRSCRSCTQHFGIKIHFVFARHWLRPRAAARWVFIKLKITFTTNKFDPSHFLLSLHLIYLTQKC